MTPLSSAHSRIQPHYEVVIVGSGYGGGIAASRLSRAGRQVCLLERGRELHPGQYPNNKLDFFSEVQFDLPDKHIGADTALFDLRFNKDINVVVGCGLGGTSLINASIALRPDESIFGGNRWPAELQDVDALGRFFAYAEDMLKAVPCPTTPTIARQAALRKVAERAGREFYPAPLLINFDHLPGELNHVGVEQQPCVYCGDCISGCNYRAKNTVLMNYLPDAHSHGATIFSQVTVRSIQADDRGWLVWYKKAGDESAEEACVHASIVILAGGSLGSTEILLRSAARGLDVSDALGSRFSGNGDMIGFSYNGDAPVHGVGLGWRKPGSKPIAGPCSTGIVDARTERAPLEGMILADGCLPGAVSAMLPLAFAAGARVLGRDTDRDLGDKTREKYRELQSKLFGAYVGAVRNTMIFLVVAQDDGSGRMLLEDDRLRISWPGVGEQSSFKRAHRLLHAATKSLGGTYLQNPIWNRFTDQNLITGHPLGGCVMADSARDGVVNHKGQVYRGSSGNAVHAGLYVMDGAVIPTSLGVNPLLAISAVAERNCHLLAEDRNWRIDYSFGSSPSAEVASGHA